MTEANFALQRRICHVVALVTILSVMLLVFIQAAPVEMQRTSGARDMIHDRTVGKIFERQIFVSNEMLAGEDSCTAIQIGVFSFQACPPQELCAKPTD